MPRPTPRAVLLLALGVPVALLPVLVHSRLWPAWLVLLAATVLLLGLDALAALPPGRLRVEVRTPELIYVGEEAELAVTLRAGAAGAGARLEIRCELHPDLAPAPPAPATLSEEGAAALAFPLRPLRRGAPTVDELWLRWTGPLGLAARQLRVPVGREVAVVPNVRAVRRAALRFFTPRQFLSGLKVERYLGDGSEFESLREYAPGLDPRSISWKATARHRRLLAQEFRAERNHQLVLAIDTGRLMTEPLLGVPRLDHAVTAALLLGYVGLRLGDRVGLFGFDEKVRAFAEPQGGLAAFPRLQRLTARLDYTSAETNFTLGLAELSARLRRRSLVVVMTEFVDTVTAELMVDNLSRLARRQLVVFVALRDPWLDAAAWDRPGRLSDVYRSAVASDLLRERERVLLELRRLGILCVDAPPGGVSAQLLERYLEIKRRELV